MKAINLQTLWYKSQKDNLKISELVIQKEATKYTKFIHKEKKKFKIQLITNLIIWLNFNKVYDH